MLISFAEHVHHLIELLALEIAERIGAADQQIEELLDAPFAAGGLGDDLLRGDVELALRDLESIELAAANASSSAVHSTSSSRDRGKSRPFEVPPTAWPSAADALQERIDRSRRAELAHQVDIADIDAELQRCRRDEQFELAALSRCSASKRSSFAMLP